MRNRAPRIEWIIADSDAEWEHLQRSSLPDSTSDTRRSIRLKGFLYGMIAFLLIVGAGGWQWSTTQKTVLRQETRPVVPELEPLRAGILSDLAASRSEGLSPLAGAAVHVIELQGDQAVVQVVTNPEQGAPAHRQTRFYRQTDAGWRETAPDAALWGPERSLETASFIYHFRENDAQVIAAVAVQIAEIYRTLRRDLGLSGLRTGHLYPFNGEKLIIDVRVTQNPGDVFFRLHDYERFVMNDRLVVASPARYWAPAEVTDAELLAQSIILPLLDHLLAQTGKHHTIPDSWQPLVDGLRLWQVWGMELPLAAWHDEIVKWLYLELKHTTSWPPDMLPERHSDLCSTHKLWMVSPTQLNIPLLCADADWDYQYVSSWYFLPTPTGLNQIYLPARQLYPEGEMRDRGQTVAVATLLDYAVATYGRNHLPLLVAALAHHGNWETLIPAVYGVSPAEFEAGWQAHLADRYGVSSIRNQ